MKYRRMGKTGLKVSEIALGSWLTYGTVTEQDAATACVKQAVESGINHFDCSNAYGSRPHEAEAALARALAPFPRHSYVLTTKAYWPVGPGPNDQGLSRKHIRHEVELSLKTLNTDYLDIFYCHRYDADTDLEETLRAMDDLVTAGKILYAGVSEWTAAQIAEGAAISRRSHLHALSVNQPAYNMLHRSLEKEIMPLCAREGIGLVVFSPLAQGLLTGKYRKGQDLPQTSRAAGSRGNYLRQSLTDANLDKVEKLAAIAQDLDIPLAQLALAWILRRPEVTSALIGATRPEQVEENVRASDVHLEPATLERIDAVLSA